MRHSFLAALAVLLLLAVTFTYHLTPASASNDEYVYIDFVLVIKSKDLPPNVTAEKVYMWVRIPKVIPWNSSIMRYVPPDFELHEGMYPLDIRVGMEKSEPFQLFLTIATIELIDPNTNETVLSIGTIGGERTIGPDREVREEALPHIRTIEHLLNGKDSVTVNLTVGKVIIQPYYGAPFSSYVTLIPANSTTVTVTIVRLQSKQVGNTSVTTTSTPTISTTSTTNQKSQTQTPPASKSTPALSTTPTTARTSTASTGSSPQTPSENSQRQGITTTELAAGAALAALVAAVAIALKKH